MLDAARYNRFRVSPIDPSSLRCEGVEATLNDLRKKSSGKLHVSRFGDSFEGRPLYLAEIGTGSKRILLWSQMHGDEPTHTAVLLDLISYLLAFPSEPAAEEILASCTLLLLPLLNPDGAERNTRNNAQDIDINRDARRLATPEGRALQRAVDSLKPSFGFNLHNQNARTAVGSPARSVAVSVLAPPIDYDDPQTDQIRAAKQIAAAIVAEVQHDAPAMVSRYDADFMPRCFGEAIQSQGVTTVLIEAGGWPADDPSPLVELHFHALLGALRAIASGTYHDFDVAVYDSLPRSNEHPLFDVLIRKPLLLDASCNTPFVADVGVNCPHGNRLTIGGKPEGRIVELGDLELTSGKFVIDSCDHLIIPGRIALLPGFAPGESIDTDTLEALLAKGTTSVIGQVSLADRTALDSLDADTPDSAVNVGYVASIDGGGTLPSSELLDRAMFAISRGVLAIVGDSPDPSLRRYLTWFNVPLLTPGQLASPNPRVESIDALVAESQQCFTMLGIRNRGQLSRESYADLLLIKKNEVCSTRRGLDRSNLDRVMVAGEIVWQDGCLTGRKPGMVLRANNAGLRKLET